MATPAHNIECTKKEVLAPGVFELRFTKPEGMMFLAGQFFLFDIPLVDDLSDVQTRALSIASSPEESELIFVIKIKPEGRLGRWITDICKVGKSVRIQGPLGLFTVKDEPSLIFIATGAGVAPLRSQLKFALEEAQDKRQMHLVFGVREMADFFWMDDFIDLAVRFPNFTFHPILSGTDTSWQGLRGRVQQHIKLIVSDMPNVGAYICGAPEMVQDVKTLCLTTLGMPKAQVHAEGYM